MLQARASHIRQSACPHTPLGFHYPSKVYSFPASISISSILFRSHFLYKQEAMSRSGQPPDLKKYMDKRLQIKLNANRMVTGVLRGFDQFMNLVIDNTVEENGNEKNEIGTVVIRGNSVVTVEALEPVQRMQG
ncbi:putative small nuclear ribonucleoprotein G [Drosera capensis]